MFQSSPSPKTGRYFDDTVQGFDRDEFQSSPSPKTGRYVEADKGSFGAVAVPILTQSEDWALFRALV